MTHEKQYHAGMSAYTSGRFEAALEHLTPLAGEGGAAGLLSRFYVGQAHYRLAIDLLADRQYETAAYHFQAAARHHPEGGGLVRFLVSCHLGCGRVDRAVRELEGALRASPNDPDARVRLALAQWRNGASSEAAATLREGLRRQPGNAELHYQLGVLLAAGDDLAGAADLFERAIHLDPRHARAHERLAQCHGVSGRRPEAVQLLERASRLDPSNHRAALQLKLLCELRIANCEGPNPQSAIRNPQSSGFTLGSAGRDGEGPDVSEDGAALDRLAEAVLMEPDFVPALMGLPETQVDVEVFSTIAAILERALRKHPEYADLHYHCGAVHRRLGHNREAIAHAEKAVQINPRYVQALILLARLYAQSSSELSQWNSGQPRDACALLERAIAAGGDYPDVHYMMGRLAQKTGRVGRARQAFRRALELNTQYQAAREALVALDG